MKPCGPELFVGNFQIIDSVFSLVIDLFRFSISSWYILGRLYVSRDLSFLQGCPSLFLFNIISQGPLYFCSISCNTSSFFSNFIWVFSFSWWIYLQVCLFCLHFFLKALSFIDPFYCLFSLCFICFHSVLCYFFPSTGFGLLLFFSF